MLEGDLSIANIESIHADILKKIGDYDELSVKVHKVRSMDLSTIQLLHSLKKHYNSVSLRLEIQVEEDLSKLLSNNGIGRSMTIVTEN